MTTDFCDETFDESPAERTTGFALASVGALNDTEQVLDLGHQIVLACSVPEIGQLRARITFHNHQLVDHVFDKQQPFLEFHHSGRVRADGTLEVDVFNGGISWDVKLQVHDPRPSHTDCWKSVIHTDRDEIMRFDPTIGSVGRDGAVGVPVVDDPVFGISRPCTPVILRLHVDDTPRHVAEVGEIVKSVVFPNHQPFTYNTMACVGALESADRGAYADPLSIWFNVFFGFYQVDCDKRRWNRPFAYQAACGRESVPEPDEVVLLGQADWNWFSNWMYGVPMRELHAYSTGCNEAVDVTVAPSRVRIGSTMWDQITLRGVKVASCYESDATGARRLTHNTIMTPIWRRGFGLPCPRPGYRRSFIPTTVDAEFDMAYWEDDDAYHTVMFGGTAVRGSDPDGSFVRAQTDATRAIIQTTYPDLGFST